MREVANAKVGRITHFYDKIGVAVVEVLKAIKVGDTVKISGHDQEFTQTISSMQIEHEQIDKASKGQTVGMKMDKPVKENDELFLASWQTYFDIEIIKRLLIVSSVQVFLFPFKILMSLKKITKKIKIQLDENRNISRRRYLQKTE